MNSKDMNKLNEIINHIQRDMENRINACSNTYMKGTEIFEPYLRISMKDYRTLCRMANVLDTLSVEIEDMRVFY